MQITSKILTNGINLTCLQAEKFKANIVSLTATLKMGENNAYAAILPEVLSQATQNFKTRKQLAAEFDSLYGTTIMPVLRKCGQNLAIGFTADVIDEKFAEKGLTQKVISLMAQMWQQPFLENGNLSSEIVKTEKKNLIDRIGRLKNDPRSYVVRRMKEIMHDGEPCGLCELGDVKTVQSITEQSLTEYWQNVLKNAPMQIFYCGSMKSEEIENIIESSIKYICQPIKYDNPTILYKETKDITEEMPVSQGKLAMGFKTGITGQDEQYPALMLFNTILGGYTGSRLFCNVREKLSLCYYASSSLDKFCGTMTVTSGIENKNAELTKNEILSEISSLKNGEIEINELETARKTIIDGLNSMQDTPQSLEMFYQGNMMSGFKLDLDELKRKISEVSLDDVIKVSQNVNLDTIYFLRGANDAGIQ